MILKWLNFVRGHAPKDMTETQLMFIRWNAERLDISLEESQARYLTSWSAMWGGHAGPIYRLFNSLSYRIFQVFWSDSTNEIYDAYQFHGPMHFLRMLAYPDPQWCSGDPLVERFAEAEHVTVVDYGCGLAQKSRAFARHLQAQGKRVELVLVDIPTVRKEFLLWMGEEASIKTTFLGCSEECPMPSLPECDVCFVEEFFEHVYEPLNYLRHIDGALRIGGVFVTNILDHGREFMHVSPVLDSLRTGIRELHYEELESGQVFCKKAMS